MTYAADVELSYRPLRQNRLGQHLDDQVSVVQRILIEGPVVVTLHLDAGRKRRTVTSVEHLAKVGITTAACLTVEPLP